MGTIYGRTARERGARRGRASDILRDLKRFFGFDFARPLAVVCTAACCATCVWDEICYWCARIYAWMLDAKRGNTSVCAIAAADFRLRPAPPEAMVATS